MSRERIMLIGLDNGNWIDPLLVAAVEYSPSIKFSDRESLPGVRIYMKDGDRLIPQFIPYSSDEEANSKCRWLGEVIKNRQERASI